VSKNRLTSKSASHDVKTGSRTVWFGSLGLSKSSANAGLFLIQPVKWSICFEKADAAIDFNALYKTAEPL